MDDEPSHDAAWALSIRQPWAELILRGLKSIELRKWATDYRGPLWLHAGKKMDIVPSLALGDAPLFLGGYVGHAVLRTILPIDARRWEDWRMDHCDPGPYVPGYCGWGHLGGVVRLREPVPAPGQLSLFKPTLEHLAMLCLQLEQAL